jgi:Flp pilus assembly protein TadD
MAEDNVRRDSETSRQTDWALLIVAALATVSYVNTLQNELVFDDRGVILDNPVVRNLDLEAVFTHDFWGRPKGDPAHNGSYRPLTTLTYLVNYAADGLSPDGYHLVNVLLHGVCSCLVYFVSRRLLLAEKGALAAAALFATHPVHTEAVANVAGRAELLAGIFLLGSMLLYLRYRERPRKTTLLWLVAAYLAAVLSKESAIVLPGVLFAVDCLLPPEAPGGRRWAGIWRDKAILAAYGALALAAVAYVLVRSAVVGKLVRVPFTEVENPMAFAPALPRWLTRLYVLTTYVRLLGWPVSLSADYSFNQIPLIQCVDDPRNLATLLAIGVFLSLLCWSYRRAGILCFALVFGAVTFSVASNLVIPIGTVVGERLLYVPCLGFCLAVAWGAVEVEKACKRPSGTVLAGAFLVALTALYTARTVVRNRDWRSDMAVMQSAARVSPNSVKVNSNLGHLHAQNGDFAAAERYYRKALAIRPHHVQALVGLCALLGQKGRVEEMMEFYRQLARLEHGDAENLFKCALALQKAGKFKEAVSIYEDTLQMSPAHAEARLNIGYCRETSGDPEGAIRSYQEASRANPADPRPVYNLMLLFLRESRFREAEKALLAAPEAFQRRPELLNARYNLAVKFIERKDLRRAADHFEFILRHSPQFPNAAQMEADLRRWRKEDH